MVLQYTALLSLLVWRFLGLSPSLFKYFRDPEISLLWGQRRVELTCENNQVTHETMLSILIQQRILRDGEPFYEISSPTLKQDVRNHFDCQTLTGARLAGPLLGATNEDRCTFSINATTNLGRMHSWKRGVGDVYFLLILLTSDFDDNAGDSL